MNASSSTSRAAINAGLPLPGVVDAGKGAIVLLEAEVEGELQVVVGDRVGDALGQAGDARRQVGSVRAGLLGVGGQQAGDAVR